MTMNIPFDILDHNMRPYEIPCRIINPTFSLRSALITLLLAPLSALHAID